MVQGNQEGWLGAALVWLLRTISFTFLASTGGSQHLVWMHLRKIEGRLVGICARWNNLSRRSCGVLARLRHLADRVLTHLHPIDCEAHRLLVLVVVCHYPSRPPLAVEYFELSKDLYGPRGWSPFYVPNQAAAR